jgi:tRNA (guanine-N7-)-methyltransferase
VSATPHRYLYGRHTGRYFTAAHRHLLAEGLERYAVMPGEHPLAPSTLFPPSCTHYAVEIGFGHGHHLLALARRFPGTGFLGIEPFRKGLATVVEAIEREELHNIRLYPGAAQPLLRRLPDGGLRALYALFPDPWPKKRHHKRRLVDQAFADQAARLLSPGGMLCVASDDADYQLEMLNVLTAHPHFTWNAERCTDWETPFLVGVVTDYQAKALAAGRTPVFLRLVRKGL